MLAYLNGRWIDEPLHVPVTDAGFVLGVTVAEQMRTFGGTLFRLEEHLARLRRSLQVVGVTPSIPLEQLAEDAKHLARENHRQLDPGDDLGLSLFITPGTYSTFQPDGSEPLVGMHTYPIPFRLWADKYTSGQALMTTNVTQVPASCWPPELKCRSRMHYYLADREAARRRPGARALLLDQNGFVSEASTANIVLYRRGEGLISPPSDTILAGISVGVLRELADELKITWNERPLRPEDVYRSDEVFLTSTSPCLLPVTVCDGHDIGDGRPGPVGRRLLDEWGRRVNIDIVAQARRFANR